MRVWGEEGANTTFPATPLGKKVVTEGREEGPDEGEPWRLAMSRRRRRSSADEAQYLKLCALANKLNHHYFAYASQEELERNVNQQKKWYIRSLTSESLERCMIEHNVEEKDADSLTSDGRNLYGVEGPLFELLQDATCSRRLRFKKHLFI